MRDRERGRRGRGIGTALSAAPAVRGLADRGDGIRPPHGYGLNGENNNEPDGQEPNEAPWKCSDRQRELILKLVDEHHLQPADVEALARERFNKRVRELGKLEASGLIDELLEKHGGNGGRANGNRRPRRNAYARRET